jgi:hypothetical protein
VRPNTAGGKARELFARLPGVAQGLALSWFEAGCTSIDDVLQLVQAGSSTVGSTIHPGSGTAGTADRLSSLNADSADAAAADAPVGGTLQGVLDTSGTAGFVLGTPSLSEAIPLNAAPNQTPSASYTTSPAAAAAEAAGASGGVSGAPINISKEALYSLQYSQDLLEAVSESDIHEMQQVLLTGLCEAAGTATTAAAAAGAGAAGAGVAGAGAGAVPAAASGGWQIELVGGGRRHKSVHDADFLVSHPTVQLEGERTLLLA